MNSQIESELGKKLISILSKHCGETGLNEGAEETLNRIIQDAGNFRKIVKEYNARWKSVVTVEQFRKRLEYLKNWKGVRKEWHEKVVEEFQKILEGDE